MKRAIRSLSVSISVALLLAVPAAWAETDNNVVCSGCIGSGDLAKRAVTPTRHKSRAIKTSDELVCSGCVGTGDLAKRAVTPTRNKRQAVK